MAWNATLTKLNNILAELYPNKDQSEMIVDMAGIPSGNIAFKDAAKSNWYYILKEADRRNKVEDLVQVVQNEYPDNEELMKLYSSKESNEKPIEGESLNEENEWSIKEIKDFLKNGKTEKAIKALDNLSDKLDADIETEVILLSARYKRLNKERIMGTIDDNHLNIETNKINFAILDLISEID